MDGAANADCWPLDDFLLHYNVGFVADDCLQSDLLWPVPPSLNYYDS